MSRLINRFRSRRRLANRLRNARPGSVLILVVALLVLMALIGTAWLTTAREDRYGSQQNTYNTQVDLLVKAVINLAQSAISDDLFGGDGYRATPGNLATDYEHYDTLTIEPPPAGSPAGTPGIDHDAFLGSRVPSLDTPTNTVYWPSVSGSPMTSGFVAPYAVVSATGVAVAQLPVTYTQRRNLIPSFIDVKTAGGSSTRVPAFDNVTVTLPTGTVVCKVLAADTDGDGIADSALFPLLNGKLSGVTYYGTYRIIDNNSAVNANTAWQPAAAAAGLQFFPSNINLPWLLNPIDPNTNAVSTTETPALQVAYANAIRFTADKADDTLTTVMPSATPQTSTGVARADFTFVTPEQAFWTMSGSRLANPGYNGPSKYNPFSISEQMRLANKFVLRDQFSSRSVLEDATRFGNSIYDNAPKAPYKPEDVVLWYQQNFNYATQLSTAATMQPQMPVRAVMVTSNPVSNAMPDRAHSATSGAAWNANAAYRFGDTVLYAPAGGFPRTYVAKLDITAPATGGNIAPDAPNGDFYWAPMSWQNQPARASVNTASFDELWMAYIGVMDARPAGGQAIVAPYPVTPAVPPTATAPKLRRQFRSPLREPRRVDPTNVGINGGVGAGVVQMMPDQVLKLRAALAAANTIDLRDSDRDVTARRVILKAIFDNVTAPAAGPVERDVDVNVYGYEAQPFITEVYVNNFNLPYTGASSSGPAANQYGYVAIELFNPYPFDIPLYNTAGATTVGQPAWQIGVVDRRPVQPPADAAHAPDARYYSRYPFMVMQPLTAFDGFHALAAGPGATAATPGPVVPAGGHLLLENYATPDDIANWNNYFDTYPDPTTSGFPPTLKTEITKAAQYRPVSTKLPLTGVIPGVARYYVPSLHEIVAQFGSTSLRGGEVYLLRPRRSDGTLTFDDRPDSSYPYDERRATQLDPEVRQPALSELIPVDSIDCAGMAAVDPANTAGPYTLWHYVRQATVAFRWKCMYPGRWDATSPWNLTPAVAGALDNRTEGIHSHPQGATDQDPWDPAGPVDPASITEVARINLGADDAATSIDHPPGFGQIQLANTHWAGWNPLLDAAGVVTPAPFNYPYGGFTRNGDVLQVPFFGSYRVQVAPGDLPAVTIASTNPNAPTTFAGYKPFLELNPLTQDLVFAHDADTLYGNGLATDDADNDTANAAAIVVASDDGDEQVGRFCPIHASPRDRATAVPPLPATVALIFDFDLTSPLVTHRYAWATDLFDYLTVWSPQNDYLPDVDPAELDYGMYQPAPPAGYHRKYPTPFSLTQALPPMPPFPTDPNAPEPISNKTGGTFTTANNGKDDGAGIDGLININTASAFVLAAVPFVPPDQDNWTFDPTTGIWNITAPDMIPDNYQIAQAIVRFRDVDDGSGAVPPVPHGPFKSLFELNLIYDTSPASLLITDPLLRPGFRNLWGTYLPSSAGGVDPDDADGDFSPYNAGAAAPVLDGVRDDFEERFLVLNRVSNLLTTRSDTFTVYLQVQGWRGVGTAFPELVVQRRAAFIADRNSISKANRSVTSVNIPVD
jgi:hypothetical protein